MQNIYYNYIPEIRKYYDFNYGVIMTRFNQTYKNIDYAWFRFIWIKDFYVLKKIAVKRTHLFSLAVIWWFIELFWYHVLKIILTSFMLFLYFYFLIRTTFFFVIKKIYLDLSVVFFHKLQLYIFYRIGLNGCTYFYTHPTFFFVKMFIYIYMYFNILKKFVLTYCFFRSYIIMTYTNFFIFVYIKQMINAILFMDWNNLYKKPYAYKEKASDIDIYDGDLFSILSILVRTSGFILFLFLCLLILILDIDNFFLIIEMSYPLAFLLSLNFFALSYEKIYIFNYYLTGYLMSIVFFNSRAIFDFFLFNFQIKYLLFVLKYCWFYFFYGIYFIYLFFFFLLLFHIYLIILHNTLSEFLYYKFRQFF